MSASDAHNEFLQVLNDHKGILFKIANAYCYEENERKDLIQEMSIQLWRSFDRYDSRYKWSTWIYRIALNVAISHIRKEKTRSNINNRLDEGIIAVHKGDEQAEIPSAENENVNLLNKAIQELKEFDRALIILHLEENDHQTIADILGISATNVSTRLSRIKDRIRKKFEQVKTKQ